MAKVKIAAVGKLVFERAEHGAAVAVAAAEFINFHQIVVVVSAVLLAAAALVVLGKAAEMLGGVLLADL